MVSLIVLAVGTGQVLFTTFAPTEHDCEQTAMVMIDHYKKDGIDVTAQCVKTMIVK